jgi:hypothetical protein
MSTLYTKVCPYSFLFGALLEGKLMHNFLRVTSRKLRSGSKNPRPEVHLLNAHANITDRTVSRSTQMR